MAKRYIVYCHIFPNNKRYVGCREAARLTGLCKDGIRLCVKGVYKQTRGTHWVRLSDVKGGDVSCLIK